MHHARILGRTGASAGITHDLGNEARLGRSSANDIVINSPFLSGQHARIYTDGGQHWIEDLGSRNGTRVDGVALTRPVCLDTLHVITLADVIDLVYVRGDAASAATRSAEATHDADPGHEPAQPPQPAATSGATPRTAPAETVYDLQFDPLVDPRAAGGQPDEPATPPAGPVGNAEEAPPAGRTDAPVDRTMISEFDASGFIDPRERTAKAEAEPEPEPEDGATAEATTAEPEPEPESEPQDRTMIGAFDMDAIVDPRGAGAEPVSPPAPATAHTHELILTLPDGGTRVFPLKPGENVLGRSADCDVTVPDPDRWLSRHHAILTLRPDGATLADQGTMNGTSVAGVQITSVQIAPDTTFRLGPFTELKFVSR